MKKAVLCLVAGLIFIGASVQANAATLRGSFASGTKYAPATFTTDSGITYDINFPDNLKQKEYKLIQQLIDQCSEMQNRMCEIEANLKKTSDTENGEGIILDIKSIKRLK